MVLVIAFTITLVFSTLSFPALAVFRQFIVGDIYLQQQVKVEEGVVKEQQPGGVASEVINE